MTSRLTTSESLALDAIRILASITVAFGHLTQKPFSTGWINPIFVAREAVAVFFVLSGFVIRHVTVRRAASLPHYLADRASRIYSVAVPALLLTLLTDTIALHVNPVFYAPWLGDYAHPFTRIGINLLFSGQLWSHAVNPLSNGPYWSINYEVAYYLAYGCFFYLSGISRWAWILLLCLFFGPRIVYLAPLWILGCLMHDLYQHWASRGVLTQRVHRLVLVTALTLVVMGGVAKTFPSLHHRLPASLYPFINSVSLTPNDYLFGIIFAIALLEILVLARRLELSPKARFPRSLHFISEGTFPLYLLHLPLFVFIAACVPYNHANAPQKLSIFATVLVLSILAGHPANILKTKLRSIFIPQPLQGDPS